jgi:hypothetical protein
MLLSLSINAMGNLMQWKQEPNGKLALYVEENSRWVRYNNSKYYQPDFSLSSNNGFATAQRLLKLGYSYLKGVGTINMYSIEDVEHKFKYHPCDKKQVEKIVQIRQTCGRRLGLSFLHDDIEERYAAWVSLKFNILELCPESSEKNKAISELDRLHFFLDICNTSNVDQLIDGLSLDIISPAIISIVLYPT